MGVGAFIEPLVVVSLLAAGTYINRNRTYRLTLRAPLHISPPSSPSLESGYNSPLPSDSLLSHADADFASSSSLSLNPYPPFRKRILKVFNWHYEISTPNTAQFRTRLLSRILRKYPFLVEAWYWALIYWVYQLGRAVSALMLVDSTVDTARRHALQVIHLEQRLGVFMEREIQGRFLERKGLMVWTNRVYSFIHIPGTIAFLVGLYWYTTTKTTEIDGQKDFISSYSPSKNTTFNNYRRPRSPQSSRMPSLPSSPIDLLSTPITSDLYTSRRRTMALCNLLAFIIFTLWPCMPPRLLSSPDVPGPIGREARSYGFIDSVHGEDGESSVWTQNRFCNQYAAMPSLHFGYSLLVGVSVMALPLHTATLYDGYRSGGGRSRTRRFFGVPLPRKVARLLPSWRRPFCISVGLAYPTVIFIAIVATANHFILDAVAGAAVCGVAWWGNRAMLNLLPVEDWFLWLVGVEKPSFSSSSLGFEQDTWRDADVVGWNE